MSSPESIPFHQFIKIDRRKSEPVYLQIVVQFIQAVQRRLLSVGDQLPGSRKLSKELKVHRKTIVSAMEELKLQGWVTTKPSVGTFVLHPEEEQQDNPPITNFSLQEKASFRFKKSFVLETTAQKTDCNYRFNDGLPDYKLVSFRELSRFYSSALKDKKVLQKTTENTLYGNAFFRKQLSYYINLTRGFHISAENIMTARSREVVLYILMRLLVETDDLVLVTNYNDPLSNMMLRQSGGKLQPIPMDEQGIQTDFIREKYNPGEIKVIYVKPNHHYPTTICFSEERREDLLQLSQTYGFVIIEDDTDAELTYKKSTAISLIKRKQAEQVLYLGSFGKFFPSGFQTHYLLGPKDVVKEAHNYVNIFSNRDVVKEQALGQLIYEGEIHRYRRKILRTYRERSVLFAKLLKNRLGSYVNYEIPTGGLAFWIQLKTAIPLYEFAERCAESSLYIPHTCLYQNAKITALRLGFGHLTETEMETAVEILYKNLSCPRLK